VLEWEPLDTARALLREFDDDGEVAAFDSLLEALRRQLDTERYLANARPETARALQRGRGDDRTDALRDRAVISALGRGRGARGARWRG
jgi:hypothetical protein